MKWHKVRIDSCARIVGGATPATSEPSYWDGDVPWATPKDLSGLDGAILDDTPRKITQEGLASCSAEILPTGSVLFSSRAPIGHVAINRIPMATNQGFKSLIPDTRKLDSLFLYFWLRANREYLKSLGNGATFKEVSKEIVSRLEIPLPPLGEQRRIAAILDKADALRQKRRLALQKLGSLAESIFLDMFGDPASNPRKWPIVSLGDLLDLLEYGPRFYDESYTDSGVRIVRITDLDSQGRLDFTRMPRLDVNEEDQRRYLLQSGDIIFARTGATVGKLAVIDRGHPPCIAGAYFIRMHFAESRIVPIYMKSVLCSQSIQATIARQSRQAAQQNFSGPALRRLQIPLPPYSLQGEFAERLSKVHSLAGRSDISLARLDGIFSALQHSAFRGEL